MVQNAEKQCDAMPTVKDIYEKNIEIKQYIFFKYNIHFSIFQLKVRLKINIQILIKYYYFY